MNGEGAKMSVPQGLTVAGAREPDFTLNLHQAYHTTSFRIVTARSTINFSLRDGKLDKVTQTETIKV